MLWHGPDCLYLDVPRGGQEHCSDRQVTMKNEKWVSNLISYNRAMRLAPTACARSARFVDTCIRMHKGMCADVPANLSAKVSLQPVTISHHPPLHQDKRASNVA